MSDDHLARHLVVRRHGPGWAADRPLEDQAGWAEHSAFMDDLSARGVVVMGGPVAGSDRVVLVIEAADAHAVEAVLAGDPWTGDRLVTDAVQLWEVRVDGRDWHAPLRHIKGSDAGGDTTQTGGMQRYEAISGKTVGAKRLWMGRTHVAPATASANHHHGEAETAIYVVSGRPEFVFAEGREEVRVVTGPGDFVFVPPWVPHREENPDPDEEAILVIARSTQEGIVVNLPTLWAEEA